MFMAIDCQNGQNGPLVLLQRTVCIESRSRKFGKINIVLEKNLLMCRILPTYIDIHFGVSVEYLATLIKPRSVNVYLTCMFAQHTADRT